MDKQESQPKVPEATVPPTAPPTVPPTPAPVIPVIPKEKPEKSEPQPAPQQPAPQQKIPEKTTQPQPEKKPPTPRESLLGTKLALTTASYYDPLKYRLRTDYEPEFGKSYEGIIPDEAEVRFIGNRRQRCFYYIYGVEVCKHDMLMKKSNTFLPCKGIMDAMWRCFTDNKYGTTMEEAPEYVRPWQHKFFDCFFHKSFGMEVCWPLFSNMVRTIYRRPDSKLSKWY